MLEQIRTHTHGWVAWVFLFCIAIVFVFWGAIGLRLEPGRYIEVNGKKLYPYQIDSFKQTFPRADLIPITLGTQQLEKAGFYISNKQIEDVIKGMPDFNVDGKFSADLYTKLLRRSPQQFEIIKTGVLYNSLIEQSAFAMQLISINFPSTTADYFKLMDQKRTVASLRIKYDKFINDISVSKQELNNYYAEHKNKFMAPAKVKLEYIKLNYRDIVKNVNLTEQEIADYYQNNIDQFILAGRKRISQIVIDVSTEEGKSKLETVSNLLKNNNVNFEDLVAKYSDDLLSAKQKGDAGWFQLGDLGDKALDTSIAKLNNIGDVSPAILSKNRAYFFKLTNSENKNKLPLSSVKADVAKKVADEKANNTYSDLKEQLERKSFENSDSLDSVAEELGLKLSKTDWIMNTNGVEKKPPINKQNTDFDQELANNSKVLATAFSEDVYENKNNSGFIELGPDYGVVIRVAEAQPDRVQSLEEISPQLTDLIKNIKARDKAKEIASKFWSEFVSVTSAEDKIKKLEALGKNNSYVTFNKPSEIAYIDTFWDNKASNLNSYNKEELKEAFALPKPTKELPVQAKILSLENGDQTILVVSNVKLGELQTASEDQRLQAANQLKYFTMMRDNGNFFNRIQKEAVIKSYM